MRRALRIGSAAGSQNIGYYSLCPVSRFALNNHVLLGRTLRRHADSHLYHDSGSAGRLEFPELKSGTLPAVLETHG